MPMGMKKKPDRRKPENIIAKHKLINAAYQAHRAGLGFNGVVDAVLANLR
jgi:hypothetical protein